MNKTEREELRKKCKQSTIAFGRNKMLPLLDYVDTLEAACERAADIASVISRSDTREIYMILSEALDKGK